MHFNISHNRDWFIGFLWNRFSGLEIQLGPIGLWFFPGRKP